MERFGGLERSLRELIPDRWRVSTSPAVLEQHSGDLTYLQSHQPDVVVYPATTAEVSRVMTYANQQGVPVTPFGMGTSVEGQVIPTKGGISLDLTRMDQVLDLRPGDLQADVQAGTRRSQLARAAGEHGLFFPVDPGADATLGGMAATAASGTTTVRYGGMRAQVLGLEVVLADGKVVRTGGRVVKSSAGYDLNSVLVGSEGTLGVITELTLRLFPILDYVAAVQAAFPDPHAACRAAAAMVGAGVLVSRCEYLGAEMIAMMNSYKARNLPEAPHLWIEFGGASEAGVAGDIEAAREIAAAEGCLSFLAETDHALRIEIWDTRHDALHAIDAATPGRKLYLTDVCVPISQLPEAFSIAPQLLADSGLTGALVGHVGDGNYHFGLAVDPESPEELARAKALNERIVTDALSRGGTCTGEHGIGLGKREFLEREHGDALSVMRAIRKAMDPNGILNPGKVV
jgi:D-lactate dehydrogenase (cytochrome)